MIKDSFVFRGARILTPHVELKRGYVEVESGVIVSIGSEPYKRRGLDEVWLEGLIVAPGFIDTHIHGLEGKDVMAASLEDFDGLSGSLVKYGVTSYMPSTISSPGELLARVCRAYRLFESGWSPEKGSRPLGMHFEGPYISAEKAGAHRREHVRKPSWHEFSEFLEECNNGIRSVTVAPELEGALEFIRKASSQGLIVQAGHSNATYEEALKGIAAGVTKATHLFNAMRQVHQREPGVAVALMEAPAIWLEIIPDLVHVHPSMIKLAMRVAGLHRLVAISDSISAAGLENGYYKLGDLEVVVEGGKPRVAGTEVLAGSTLTLDRALRNLVGIGFSLSEALSTVSYNAAASVGTLKAERVGALRPGYKADMVVLDGRLRVRATIVEGVLVYGSLET